MSDPSGFLLINKPLGLTSFQVIQRLRRISGIRKIGHCGTLDKNATGLLVLGVGKHTKLLTSLVGQDKTYVFRMKFGLESETNDMVGVHYKYQTVDKRFVSEDRILELIQTQFLGEIEQIPPLYSALKKEGKRFSDYARDEEAIDLLPRKVTIHSFTLESFLWDSYYPSAVMKVTCSHGTYIRSICRDMGYGLNTLGIMTNLCRLKLGSFLLADAIPLDSIPSGTFFMDCLTC